MKNIMDFNEYIIEDKSNSCAPLSEGITKPPRPSNRCDSCGALLSSKTCKFCGTIHNKSHEDEEKPKYSKKYISKTEYLSKDEDKPIYPEPIYPEPIEDKPKKSFLKRFADFVLNPSIHEGRTISSPKRSSSRPDVIW